MRKDGRLADRMLEILIAGVSTRRYKHVLPEMAETVACPGARSPARRSRPVSGS